MKKKVLIISYSFPPSNAPAAQRPYTIAKYLDKDKYEVTVITCGNQDASLGLSTFESKGLDKVQVIKINAIDLSKFRKIKKSSMVDKTMSEKKGSLKMRLFNVLVPFVFPDKGVFWYWNMLKYARSNRNILAPDIVFSTSPLFSNHLIARLFLRATSSPKHIVDFRDFHWTVNDSRQKEKTSRLHHFLERQILNRANFLTFITNRMRDIYVSSYPDISNKCAVIYNGFDQADYDRIDSISESKKLTFFYAGSFYGGRRDPKHFLRSLDTLLSRKLIKSDEFQIEIAGNFETQNIDELTQFKSFKNINFLGALSRKRVLERAGASHVLWMIEVDSKEFQNSVPLKFFEYLGARRPILSHSNSLAHSNEIIDKINCGWWIDTTDTSDEKSCRIIESIFKKYRDHELNEPLNISGLEKYSRISQTHQFEEYFDKA
ncbi:hypothetical protein EAX61_00130 [Dokdonia sinensis]|uniref:Uncharacterized protein n=1 Tax=Dokdonia sinensis TaxID=2479847 RepID=A0A3M0GFX8_9FLAO|nr:glycosyltransferase [Dokdonia sinensis]RMB63835.1 hypothetical protein EAX61_00130 [Dokdonia sinensis]